MLIIWTSIMNAYINKNTRHTCIVGVASGFGDVVKQSSLISQMTENKCFANAATKMHS